MSVFIFVLFFHSLSYIHKYFFSWISLVHRTLTNLISFYFFETSDALFFVRLTSIEGGILKQRARPLFAKLKGETEQQGQPFTYSFHNDCLHKIHNQWNKGILSTALKYIFQRKDKSRDKNRNFQLIFLNLISLYHLIIE